MTHLFPLISVIIPVYNGETYLAEAVHSILAQGYKPLEIIVVDDGSTDGSAAVAHAFGQKIQYVYQANQGPAAARNRGLELAQGSVISFLDADDLWPQEKLARQMGWLQAGAEIVLGYTQLWLEQRGEGKGGDFQPYAQPWLYLQVGCALLRRSLLDVVGMFDCSLRIGEDMDWFLRVRESGAKMKIIPEVTLLYRLHAQGMTRGSSPAEGGLARLIQRSLTRRRQTGNEGTGILPNFASMEERYGGPSS
jgi:glycosyltransferase involved in cell wall biosynthesis